MAFELAPFAFLVRIVPAVLLFWLAAVVFRAPLQRRANRLFALFLAVIGVGFVLEFFWITLRAQLHGATIDPGLVALSERGRDLQGLLGVVDPPLLLAASLAYLGRDRLLKSPFLWGAYALVAIPLWWEGTPHAYFSSDAIGTLHILYVNGTYLACFLFLMRGYLDDPRRFMVRELYFLAIAVGFAAFSRTGALFMWHGPLAAAVDTQWPPMYSLLVALPLIAGVWAVLGALRQDRARALAQVFTRVMVLVTAFFIAWWLMWHVPRALGWGTILFTAFYPARWIVVAGIMGYGSMRYQLFDFDLRLRQAVSLGVALLVAVFLAMLAAATVYAGTPTVEDGAPPGTGLDSFGARLVGIAAGAVVFWPSWYWASAVVRRVWPASDSVVQWSKRRLELYEAALEFALAKAEWGPAEQRFVQTLREVFEVSQEEHETITDRVRSRTTRSAPSP